MQHRKELTHWEKKKKKGEGEVNRKITNLLRVSLEICEFLGAKSMF